MQTLDLKTLTRVALPLKLNSSSTGRAYYQRQTAFLILARKAKSQNHDAVKSADDISIINGHPTSEIVPVKYKSNSLAPLTIADLSPPLMDGMQLRVAYQGVPGAYSEAAASKAYPNSLLVPCDQFEDAFQAVDLRKADRAVLPFENTLAGPIYENHDSLLLHHLHIVGEVNFPVHHCLLALSGVKKENINRVISHRQALSQCKHTLSKMGLNLILEATDDTAGAAKHIAANNLRDTGAIASVRAAELYGLDILADGIQDDLCNVTRFLILARDPNPIIPGMDRHFKTSIVFSHEESSVLPKVLSSFAFHNIKAREVLKPRRYPTSTVKDASTNSNHLYYRVDFQASTADVKAQDALAELCEFTSSLRVLGSYPMDMTAAWY